MEASYCHMGPSLRSTEALRRLLRTRSIATLPEVTAALGAPSERTVFRTLKQLGSRTSYSHRGAYYTLADVAAFDAQGLWSHRSVWFSRYGTLLATSQAFVEAAAAGYFVDELDHLVHVATKDALRKLVREHHLTRAPIGGRYLYCASNPARSRQQSMARGVQLAQRTPGGPFSPPALVPDELKAALVLFVSLLDEQHRRLYAGLEALKLGPGGDRRIADLLGLDPGTVARGRRELLGRDVEVERVRRLGGGRKTVEKKRPRSSRGSKNS